ncbi:MAG: DNA-formamidopyrimidine glycosylase family protein [Thermoanaerobaculia bacterium]
MPELPDIEVYLDALRRYVVGRRLERIRLASPFLLRSVEPPIPTAEGRRLREVRRLGKRLVLALDGGLSLVLHLMVAGRLRWREAGVKIPRKLGLAAFDFRHGSLLLTEAGSKKRASLYLVEGEEALAQHDPGGLEVLVADLATFRTALERENHTLKRALTDPRILAGIGNAYSDEILHRARLSPFRQTRQIDEQEVGRLFVAARKVLTEWTERLKAQVGDGFPEKVTAFRPGMAAHGRFGKPCPVCGSPIQRVVSTETEANYCPGCQTGGRILADRVLSRLLKGDWPRRLEELEERLPARTSRPG